MYITWMMKLDDIPLSIVLVLTCAAGLWSLLCLMRFINFLIRG